MTKRKVIEDSDDEEHAEASPQRPSATGLSDITLSTIVSLNGSPSHEIQEQTAEPSTSSTELLNRESRAAHESLIQPTPKSAIPATITQSLSQQQTPTSPTSSRLKTKRSKTSVEKPKAKKALKTYGKSSQDIFEFHGGSDGELDTITRKDLGHRAGKGKYDEYEKIDHLASRRGSQNDNTMRRAITLFGDDMETLSTNTRSNEITSTGDNNTSQQSSMHPPTSKSTSSDQSQRPRTDTMPTVSKLAPPKPPTCNVPSPTKAAYYESHSRERVAAPTRPEHSDFDEERSQEVAPSIKVGSTRSIEAVNGLELQLSDELAPNSSTFGISPSQTATEKITSHSTSISEDFSSNLDREHLSPPLDPKVSAAISPVVILPPPTDAEGAKDELSLSILELARKSPLKSATTAKRKRDMGDEPLDELGFEDDLIGIPKEHYQPRPSKRRSGDGDGEMLVPTDFSKRPEATGKGKRKTKRHKTTAFQELLPKDEDEDEDEEVKVIPDPRFDIPEKKSSKISADRNQPDGEKDDKVEENGPKAPPEPNQAAKPTGQKKRGRPKKATANLSEETVVDDEPEADHDQDGAETEEPVISATAKRSRKKSKTKDAPQSITDEQVCDGDGAPAAEDEIPANILIETHGNITASKVSEKPSSKETSPVKANNAPQPETPRRSATPASKGPDKHSPISSGKVAYRVGLSKRARIAPLLRIVRK